MSSAIVLATTAENAEALLSGARDRDHRRFPPKKLPARAYLAVVGTGSIVGECELGAAERNTAKGWALPVSKPRRYRKRRPVAHHPHERRGHPDELFGAFAAFELAVTARQLDGDVLGADRGRLLGVVRLERRHEGLRGRERIRHSAIIEDVRHSRALLPYVAA